MSIEATCQKCSTVYALSGRSVKLPFICNDCVNFEYIKDAAKPSVTAANDIIADYEKRAEDDQKLITDLAKKLADADQQAIKMNQDYQSQHKIVTSLLDNEVVLNSRINKYCAMVNKYEELLATEKSARLATEKVRENWRDAYKAAWRRSTVWHSRCLSEKESKNVWRKRAMSPWKNLWTYLWNDDRATFYCD